MTTMTTSDQSVLMGMVFKIKFLRAMLQEMAPWDIDLLINILNRLIAGESTEADFECLDRLYKKFEGKDATTISKT